MQGGHRTYTQKKTYTKKYKYEQIYIQEKDTYWGDIHTQRIYI